MKAIKVLEEGLQLAEGERQVYLTYLKGEQTSVAPDFLSEIFCLLPLPKYICNLSTRGARFESPFPCILSHCVVWSEGYCAPW